MKKILILFTAILILSCTADDTTEEKSDNFDREAMMRNLADTVIMPSYDKLSQALERFKEESDGFIANPNQINFIALQSLYLRAYNKWQAVEMYNIGMAEELEYKLKMNVFPTDPVNIENNITSGNYDLLFVNNNDAVGFPALDYMLFGLGETDEEIRSFYDTHENAAGYQRYLSDNIDQMIDLTDQVIADWENGYREEFIAGTANNASSPLNLMVNSMIEYYERNLRANKIGIPAGKFSNEPLPEKVEGLYSEQYSRTMVLEALNAFQGFFNGSGSSIGYNRKNRESIAGYLDALEDIDPATDLVPLSTMVNDQLETARTQLLTMDRNLNEQVETNNTEMLRTYDELQRAVVLMKTDMLSLLDISLSFTDSDGD